jgi:hypothetical protein
MCASHAPQISTYETFKQVPETLNDEADIKAIQERVVEEATIFVSQAWGNNSLLLRLASRETLRLH